MSYDLCEELIVEIFSRLPTKSLLRFRSVSKSICSIIGSPIFNRLYTLRSPKKLMIIQQYRYKKHVYPKIIYTSHSEDQLPLCPTNECTGMKAYEYPFDNFKIVGSCNGILCLSEYGNGIYLWNPSTRRMLSKKDNPSWSHSEGPSGFLGFGYDPIIDDYKILKITTQCVTGRGNVHSSFVFTLKTSTWSEIASPTTSLPSGLSYQCLFNGSLHWVAKWGSTGLADVCFYYILTFDLSTHVFSTIMLPAPSWETERITIINGSLAVISIENDNSWIWVMREYNNNFSWSVALKYDTNQFNRPHKVLQLSVNGDILFNSFLRVLAYNPKTEERSNVAAFSDSSSIIGMEIYVESLELLDMGTLCEGDQRVN